MKDGYLVDFVSIETQIKFMTRGITYDELSPEEQEEYENGSMLQFRTES